MNGYLLAESRNYLITNIFRRGFVSLRIIILKELRQNQQQYVICSGVTTNPQSGVMVNIVSNHTGNLLIIRLVITRCCMQHGNGKCGIRMGPSTGGHSPYVSTLGQAMECPLRVQSRKILAIKQYTLGKVWFPWILFSNIYACTRLRLGLFGLAISTSRQI